MSNGNSAQASGFGSESPFRVPLLCYRESVSTSSVPQRSPLLSISPCDARRSPSGFWLSQEYEWKEIKEANKTKWVKQLRKPAPALLSLTPNSTLVPAQRFLAFGRFRISDSDGPSFEEQWAKRKSTLANSAGFQFFALMR